MGIYFFLNFSTKHLHKLHLKFSHREYQDTSYTRKRDDNVLFSLGIYLYYFILPYLISVNVFSQSSDFRPSFLARVDEQSRDW